MLSSLRVFVYVWWDYWSHLMSLETSKGGIGVFIRNQNGEVRGAKVSSVIDAESSFCVEAKALVSAMVFSLEMGFTKVELEGDALAVIRKMAKKGS